MLGGIAWCKCSDYAGKVREKTTERPCQKRREKTKEKPRTVPKKKEREDWEPSCVCRPPTWTRESAFCPSELKKEVACWKRETWLKREYPNMAWAVSEVFLSSSLSIFGTDSLLSSLSLFQHSLRQSHFSRPFPTRSPLCVHFLAMYLFSMCFLLCAFDFYAIYLLCFLKFDIKKLMLCYVVIIV